MPSKKKTREKNDPNDRPHRPDAERRLRQASRFARVLKVLQLIQGRGRWNAKDLAAELACSPRTIHRDLDVLELAGVPWYYAEDERCYRTRPDFQFPTLNLTDEELIGQATATAITAARGLDITAGARPATRKLAASSREDAARLLAEVERVTSVLDLKLADHSRHHEAIRTAQYSLVQGKQLAGQYASPHEPEPKRLILHPYRLCLIKQAWYVIARPHDEDRPKTYRVARFKTLWRTDAPAEVPASFDLKTYFGDAWGAYRGGRSYDVKLAFAREATELVTETTWHPTQQVRRHKDGSTTLTFRVDGLNEIARWILGWSGWVEVIRPPELRAMVVEQLQAALQKNGAEGSSAPEV
jgi:predicted DNA-binding transcriptional regulator YafY